MNYEKPTVEVADFTAQEKLADLGLTRDSTEIGSITTGAGPKPNT